MAATRKKKPAARKSGARKRTAKKERSSARADDAAPASERIDRKIAELDDWRGDVLASIRELIHEADPDVVEEWKWMGSPVWSHAGIYVVGNAHKDKVKLTFSHGARLSDPKKLFNAGLGGNQWRAIDIREGDRIDRTAFKALVRRAVAYNVERAASRRKGSTS